MLCATRGAKSSADGEGFGAAIIATSPTLTKHEWNSMTNAGTAQDNLVQPNAEHQYSVTRADLPLSCPMPGMYLWNSHPKVYLPIEKEGTSKCPYCGALYTLVDE